MSDSDRTKYSGQAGNATAMRWLDTLIELIVRRLALAEDIAVGKFGSGQPVDDPIREREVLDPVARVMRDTGTYQEVVFQFFVDQIEAGKVIQRGLHQRWHVHPEELPAAHRDVAQVRPEFDRITTRMLWQLVYMSEWPDLGNGRAQVLVEKRLAARPSLRHLEGLLRDAAVTALRSFATRCPCS
jgi:chorismate mutase